MFDQREYPVNYARQNMRYSFRVMFFAVLGIMLAVAAFSVFSWLSTGWDIPDADFYRLMKQEAIEQPIKGPYQMSGCGEGDSYNSTFTGRKNGQPVSGIVCKGFNKAYTVRYF